MQYINPKQWERKELYDFFSHMSHPFYSVTFVQDVTNLYRYVKAHSCSFYYGLVYLCTRALNETEAFRYGKIKDRLVLFDQRLPSFTDLKPHATQFHIVTMDRIAPSLLEFCRQAREKSRSQTALLPPQEEKENLIYFSCLPWVEMTALTNERDFRGEDSVPRIAWGKYTEKNGRLILHISMELNHAFTDGLHIGLFHKRLCALIEDLP